MTPTLIAVVPDPGADPPWLDALMAADGGPVGRATCNTMVREVAALAPRQVVIQAPPDPQELLDALQGWDGQPPCALSLIGAPLPPALHEGLVTLGVHGWCPQEVAQDPARLRELLAMAGARWRSEQTLRVELAQMRERFDERKWVDRAKGLLMAARGMGEQEAFGLLRGAAMHANLRLGEVSRSLVETVQWAQALNRAGQLRMLSQRLARLAAQSLAGIDARRCRSLRTESAARVQDNLDHLASLQLDPAAAQALAQAAADWLALSAALAQRLAPATLVAIDARAEALLHAAERLSAALEASGARRALHIVNLCGRQRMRAQRLAKDALLATLLPDGPWLQRLEPAMDEFEVALRELEEAPLSTADIRCALASARDEWLRLVRGVRAAGTAAGRAELVHASEALSRTFDRLTASYEHSLQVIMS